MSAAHDEPAPKKGHRRRGLKLPDAPPPPPARIDDDPRLDGWRWRTQRIRASQFGDLADHHCLIAPDGWETKLYQQPTKAIAEALRRVRSRPKAADEPPLTEAEQDAMEALGWRPAGGGQRRDGVIYITARAPDESRHERTRAEWRAAIAAGERAPGDIPMSTETIPELPTIPPDLFGWEWELSEAGDARLIHPTEGYTTTWGPVGPEADYGGRLAEARKRVAADAAVAAEAVAEDRGAGLRDLPPAQIRRDGGTQARTGNNEDVVEEYTTAMREGRWTWHAGNRLVVFFDGADYWLADGFHRTEAAQRAGLATVPATVREGSRRDAVLYAVGANADHGLRRTRDDVRRAIRTLLLDEEWRAWSNAEIARRARTTDKTVATVRAEMESTSEIPRLAERVGADGKARAISRFIPQPETPADLAAAGFRLLRSSQKPGQVKLIEAGQQPAYYASAPAAAAAARERIRGRSTPAPAYTPRPHPPCARCGLPHATLIGKHCEGCYLLLEAQKWGDGSEDARWRLAAARGDAERDPDEDRRRRRLAEIAGIARDMGFASLEASAAAPPPAPAPAWAADHDKTVYADYVRRFDRCGAVLACTAPGRAPYTLHIAGRGKPVEIATWGELQAQLAAAERAHADLPPHPLAAVRSAIFAGPHRWAEAEQLIGALPSPVARQSWADDLALARRADSAMRQRDAAGAWDALQALADAELRERLLEVYAGAARELAVAWPPAPARAARLGNDPAPALPAGWSWRPRGDTAVQAWDGTIAHMTACYRPGEESEAAAHAWRIAGAILPAEPAEEQGEAPLTPPEYGEWVGRARAVGAALTRDEHWRYVLILPDGTVEPREAWLATVARIRGLEVDSPPPAPADAEEPDAIPADARPTYAAAEQRLARLLAAADPELKRFLRVIFAVAALSDDPLSDDDLWDELTGNLIAAGDELLAYALGAAPPAPAPPQPAGDPEFDRWPHVDHPALDDLSTELMGAEVATTPPDGGAVARWQDTLDAHADELDDQTYERLAHRIGELRRRVKEAA